MRTQKNKFWEAERKGRDLGKMESAFRGLPSEMPVSAKEEERSRQQRDKERDRERESERAYNKRENLEMGDHLCWNNFDGSKNLTAVGQHTWRDKEQMNILLAFDEEEEKLN